MCQQDLADPTTSSRWISQFPGKFILWVRAADPRQTQETAVWGCRLCIAEHTSARHAQTVCLTLLNSQRLCDFANLILIQLSFPKQERLDRAAKSCQDSVRDEMSSDTSTIDRAKYQKQYDDCVSKQVDEHLSRLPALIKKVSLFSWIRNSCWISFKLPNHPVN